MLFASKMKKVLRTMYNGLRTNFHKSTGSLMRVFGYSKPYKYLIIIGNIALLLATVFSVLLPKYIGEVQDIMQKEKRIDELKNIIFKIAFVLFGDIILMLVKEFVNLITWGIFVSVSEEIYQLNLQTFLG